VAAISWNAVIATIATALWVAVHAELAGNAAELTTELTCQAGIWQPFMAWVDMVWVGTLQGTERLVTSLAPTQAKKLIFKTTKLVQGYPVLRLPIRTIRFAALGISSRTTHRVSDASLQS